MALTIFPVRAQDPGAQQDAEAEREKILKAADQIDLIETNSEANRVTLESIKADVAQLKTDQASLRQQLSETQAALAKSEQARLQERKVLLAEVAALVATPTSTGGRHPEKSAATHAAKNAAEPLASSFTHAAATSATDTAATTTAEATPDPAPPSSTAAVPAPKPQHGYYHVVEKDETLGRIVAAYREQGVHVTLAQVRRANALDETSTLYVGQKLFIPKPGTNE